MDTTTTTPDRDQGGAPDARRLGLMLLLGAHADPDLLRRLERRLADGDAPLPLSAAA